MKKLMGRDGIEPPTPGFSVLCSVEGHIGHVVSVNLPGRLELLGILDLWKAWRDGLSERGSCWDWPHDFPYALHGFTP